jgi:hypothetical protein
MTEIEVSVSNFRDRIEKHLGTIACPIIVSGLAV